MADWERVFESAGQIFNAIGAIVGWTIVFIVAVFVFQVCT